MPLKLLIAEDIPAIREAIEKQVSEHPQLTVVSTFDNVEETVDFLLDGAAVDALFLDIRLFGDYAWEILRALRREDLTIPPVVLITAEEEKGYAEVFFREFREEVVDYFVKPFDEKWAHRQNECVQNIKDRLAIMRTSRAKLQRISLEKGNTTEYIPIEEVVCLHTTDRGLAIYFTGREHPHIDAYGSLGKYHEQINRPSFVRISRQSVVNTHYVEKISHRQDEQAIAHLAHQVMPKIECSKPGKKALKLAMSYAR